jgi:flagellar basal body-associated protein FliL
VILLIIGDENMEENKNELENEKLNSQTEAAPVETPKEAATPTAPAVEQPVETAPAPVEATPAEPAPAPAPEVITLPKPEEPKPKKNKTGLVITIVLLLLVVAGLVCYFVFGKTDNKENKDKGGSTVTENNKKNSPYRLSGNGLEEFDIQFLKLVGTKDNVIYSPISIKYALAMLNEGTKGESHSQIEDLIGNYKPTKYTNSANLAFGNAFFIRDDFVNEINQDTVKLLQDKYTAEVKTGSFENPKFINDWVDEKTLGLIKDLVRKEDIEALDYILVNALGIDMEWTSYFFPKDNPQGIASNYSAAVSYLNTDFGWYNSDSVVGKTFNNSDKKYQVMDINASYNNYDVVKEHGGEEKYKKEIND